MPAMSDVTPRLHLPYLAANQAQKHVTLNESLGLLDGLVGCALQSRTTAAEPSAPADGQAWLLPAGRTGAGWSDFSAGAVVRRQDGAWTELHLPIGATAYVADEAAALVRTPAGWPRLEIAGTRPAFGSWQSSMRTTAGVFAGYTALPHNLNRGGAFNPPTGLFTAPEAGAYAFMVTGKSHGATPGRAIFALQVNGLAVGEAVETHAPYQDVGGGALLQLAAGDTVAAALTYTETGESASVTLAGWLAV